MRWTGDDYRPRLLNTEYVNVEDLGNYIDQHDIHFG
jgi:hypothetical protein